MTPDAQGKKGAVISKLVWSNHFPSPANGSVQFAASSQCSPLGRIILYMSGCRSGQIDIVRFLINLPRSIRSWDGDGDSTCFVLRQPTLAQVSCPKPPHHLSHLKYSPSVLMTVLTEIKEDGMLPCWELQRIKTSPLTWGGSRYASWAGLLT